MSRASDTSEPTPHTRLAALLVTQKEVLMREWTARVRADPDVPEAKRLSEPELRDHLPSFIDELAAQIAGRASLGLRDGDLSGEAVGRTLGGHGAASAHAKQRVAHRYATSAALRELSHFRAAVVELCFRESIDLPHVTAQLLHAAIDSAMSKCATEIEQNGHRALQEEVEVRERFMAILTHDLRTPIHAVGMATHLLADEQPTERQVSYLRRITRSVQRAERMIEDMLDLARARLGGGITLNRQPTDAHDVCRRVLEEAQLTHPKRSLEFTPEGDGRGVFDPERLSQIISNLVSNALAYSPEGSVVKVGSRGLAPDHLILDVWNDGVPIPMDEIATLFEPFKRGKHGAGSTHGLGLGLFIARELALAHDGTLDVESSATLGTRFTLVLPRGAADNASPAKG